MQYIERQFSAFSEMVLGLDDKTTELGIVERVLKNTPYLIEDFGIKKDQGIPHAEKDIKVILHKYLKHIFPDTLPELAVSHIFKKYKADIAIRSLNTLIEIKYADNEQEFKNEMDGIYADMKGYSGEEQWSNFFALIYTTKPIASQERVDAEYTLSRVDISWKPIIVHGTGDRTRPTKSDKKTGRASKEKSAASVMKE